MRLARLALVVTLGGLVTHGCLLPDFSVDPSLDTLPDAGPSGSGAGGESAQGGSAGSLGGSGGMPVMTPSGGSPALPEAGLGWCGDGVAAGDEECDEYDFGGATCSSATLGANADGDLFCTGDCFLDTSGCFSPACAPDFLAGAPADTVSAFGGACESCLRDTCCAEMETCISGHAASVGSACATSVRAVLICAEAAGAPLDSYAQLDCISAVGDTNDLDLLRCATDYCPDVCVLPPGAAQCGGTLCRSHDSGSFLGELPACCVADGCGVDLSALAGIGISLSETCVAVDQPGTLDPSCTPTVTSQIGAEVTIPGCCRPDGLCGDLTSGIVSTLGDVDLGAGCTAREVAGLGQIGEPCGGVAGADASAGDGG